jgi:hypothetical protein
VGGSVNRSWLEGFFIGDKQMSNKTKMTSLTLRDNDVALLNGVPFNAKFIKLIEETVSIAGKEETDRILYDGLVDYLLNLRDGLSDDDNTFICIVRGMIYAFRAYIKNAAEAGITLPG